MPRRTLVLKLISATGWIKKDCDRKVARLSNRMHNTRKDAHVPRLFYGCHFRSTSYNRITHRCDSQNLGGNWLAPLGYMNRGNEHFAVIPFQLRVHSG